MTHARRICGNSPTICGNWPTICQNYPTICGHGPTYFTYFTSPTICGTYNYGNLPTARRVINLIF
jgi:hypothetical protein